MTEVHSRNSYRRAGSIRRRKKKRTRTLRELLRGEGRVNSVRKPPPVMARTSGTIPRRKGAYYKKTRRRYNFSLNVPGAEMSLPSLPQFKVGWRLLSFLFIAIMLYGIYQFWYSSIFRIEDIEVNGLRKISSSEVNKVLNISNEPIFSLNANEMQQELVDTFEEFSAVTVDIDLPNTVVLTVTERVPLLIWYQDGEALYVDEEGMAFSVDNSAVESGNYPVVVANDTPVVIDSEAGEVESKILPELNLDALGLIEPEEVVQQSEPLLKQEMIHAILDLADFIPEGSTLIYDSIYGIGWQDQGGWDVYFGHPEDIDIKISIYKTILRRLDDDDTRPTLISVEYIHAPFFRLE